VYNNLVVAHGNHILITLNGIISGDGDFLLPCRLYRLAIFQKTCADLWPMYKSSKLQGFIKLKEFIHSSLRALSFIRYSKV
jgi:hypothetical protein